MSESSPSASRIELLRLPTDDDLARAYHELGRLGASATGRKAPWPYAIESDDALICLCAELCRHDPRMLGVLVELMSLRYDTFHPTLLRRAMRKMRQPQTVCVVLEFARASRDDAELGLYARHVCAGVGRVVPSVHFFVDDVRPGTKLAAQRQGRSLAPYSRWGFLGMERPTVDPMTKRVVGRIDARTRRLVLERLLAREAARGITLLEYLDAIDHEVSRQQARADLIAEGLVSRGRGPGARWRRPPV